MVGGNANSDFGYSALLAGSRGTCVPCSQVQGSGLNSNAEQTNIYFSFCIVTRFF